MKIINGIGAGIGAAIVAGKETTVAFAQQVSGALGSVLPFQPVPTASTAGPTLQELKHVRRAEPDHLPPDAPNILIVLLDDVGFGLPDTLGGEVHTPTLTRLADEGVAFNQFHTTSICSPTRAALLTGRNHQRVGSGTIAERALDFDGYTGVIPKSARPSRRCCTITATRLRPSANGTIRPRRKRPRWVRSTVGPRAMASTISTALWLARPRNMSRACSRTPFRSSRRTIRHTI